MAIKKADFAKAYRVSWYALKLVYKLKPRLVMVGAAEELFTRTVPFVVAGLSARIVTELPSLADAVDRQQSLRLILMLLATILAVQMVQTVLTSLLGYYTQRHQVELSAKIKATLTEKFATLPFTMYESKEVMDRYELASHHTYNLSKFALYDVRTILGSIYAVTLATIVLLHFSVWLVIALTIVLIPRVILEVRVNREQRQNWRETTNDRRKAIAFEGLLRVFSIKDTRLFGLLEYALKKALHFEQKSDLEQIAIDRRAEKYRFGMLSLEAIAETGAMAYVTWLIYLGKQPIGQFIYVQQIMMQFSGPMSQLLFTIRDFDEFLSGADEFYEFMTLPTSAKGDTDFEPTNDITFKAISFTYPGSDKPTLRDISLTIPRGKTIAIVGENGAGKSTLVKLLMKLFDPTAGLITVGDKSLKSLDENKWHRSLGVLFQDFVSFEDFTVRENVWFGDISRSPTVGIEDALKLAHAYDFVSGLPKGVDTYLGKYMDEKNGTNLSGGQLQRLAIARVLYRDPAVLIMDEPTSAIDAVAEYEIFQEIDKARRGKTTILISHRFSTVRKADYIYVLDKGRLIESGTHEELLQLGGNYHKLFTVQATGYR